MPPEPRSAAPVDPARLGGAAADFVAGLGRKVTELRASLRALAGNPDRERGRNELRRKLHALSVGARLLHFEVLARAIGEVTARIDAEADEGRVSDALLREIGELLDRVPELAWSRESTPSVPPAAASPSEPSPKPTTAPPPAPPAPRPSSLPPQLSEPAPRLLRVTPFVVLVVGPESLARAVEDDPALFPCEVERSDALAEIVPLARAVAPDLVVLDVEPAGAEAALEALIDDPLTGPLPVIALGRFESDASRQRLVALGVAKVVDKPASPAHLRRLCRELVADPASTAHAVAPLGELSVAELVDVMAEEMRRRLVDALDPDARARRIDFGVGAAVLGPLWGALARVRDEVEARSEGALRFHESVTRTPIAVAPSLGDETTRPEGDRRVSGARRAPGIEVDLEGRTVLLADDDPQVVWFLSDVLRGAGAKVIEARDGVEALALARKHEPDLVVSDVLMPRLDGVALVRALERDVVLHDRPVILLSWKEDLLKRLRDLRMEASAMLRKEADGRTILARVREVLAGRVRVEARIAGGGEVRGRLDDLSVASLLSIVDRVRHDATVVVRDATSAFELDLDGGALRSLAESGAGGPFVHGKGALAPLLGVVAGRFLVKPLERRASHDELPAGELRDQLAPVVRTLRCAVDAVSGERLLDLVEVGLDESRLEPHVAPLPPSLRNLAMRLAKGASPRELVLSGQIAPSTLEDLLLDLATRGLVVRARGQSGDLLAAAARALEEADRIEKPPTTPPPLPLAPPTREAVTVREIPQPSGGEERDAELSRRDAELFRRDAELSRRDAELSAPVADVSGRAAELSPRAAETPTAAETEPTRKVAVPTVTLASLPSPTPPPTPPPTTTTTNREEDERPVETKPFGNVVTAPVAIEKSLDKLAFAKTLSSTPTPVLVEAKTSPHKSTLHGVGDAVAEAVRAQAKSKSDAPPATVRESPSARKLAVAADVDARTDALAETVRAQGAPAGDGPPASLRPSTPRGASRASSASGSFGETPKPSVVEGDRPTEPRAARADDNVIWWLLAALVAILALGFLIVNRNHEGAPAAPAATSAPPSASP